MYVYIFMYVVVAALAGAAAGTGFWLVAFPFDTVKSVYQAQRQGSESAWHLTRRLLAGQLDALEAPNHNNNNNSSGRSWQVTRAGLRAMYRGWGVALLRATPTSAVSLMVYESIRRVMC